MKSFLRSWAVIVVLFAVSRVEAGPWLREPGHFYLNLSYARIAASKIFGPDFQTIPIARYQQQLGTFYGEVGVAPWLMLAVDGTLVRYNQLDGQGATLGVGDFRIAAWQRIIVAPVHLAFAVTVGIPTGDAHPSAGPNASQRANEIAASLPTGDGEADLELRLSLGHAFGGVKRWPVRHYLIAEAGYWARSAFHNAFVWRFEMGTQFPWKFIDRFWFTWRWNGAESFATNKDAAQNATGLGDGVTYVSPGVSVYGRIWKGLGAAVGLDSAVRARSLAAGSQVFVTLSFQR